MPSPHKNTITAGARVLRPPGSASGADIPEELFELIVQYVVQETDSDDYPWIPSSQPAVKDITSILLVSRYFANLCRPHLFRRILLRTRRQMKGLADVLDSGHKLQSVSPLSYAVQLSLLLQDGDEPWIHQIPLVLFPRMRRASIEHLPRMTITSKNRLPALPLNGSHLPRSLPSSFFWHVHELELWQTRFERGEDLLRCLSSMRGLVIVKLTDVDCVVAADRAAIERFPLSSVLATITIRQTSESAMITLVSAVLLATIFLPHDLSELEAIMDLLMLPCRQLATRGFRQWNITRHAESFDLSLHYNSFSSKLLPSRRHSEPTLSATEAWYDLTIGCSPLYPGHNILSPDLWQELANIIARFQFLDTLCFEFRLSSFMEKFVRTIHPIIRDMHAAGRRLQFGVINSGAYSTALEVFERYGPFNGTTADNKETGVVHPETDGEISHDGPPGPTRTLTEITVAAEAVESGTPFAQH